MKKYRVYEVAEELGVETKQLIQMLHQMDVRVRSHMSTVDDAQIARLHARLERERRSASERANEAATATATATRRRRRPRPEPQPIADEAPSAETGEPADTGTVEAETAGAGGIAEAEEVAPLAATRVRDAGAERAAEEPGEPEVTEPEAAVAGPGEVREEAASVAEPGTEDGRKARRKPKPVRRGIAAGPAASAAPGGEVRIQAEGYPVDSRRGRGRREKKRQRRVDQDTVQENVKKTLAALEAGSPRRRRREAGPSQQEAERERQEAEAERERREVRVNEFLTVAELADLIGHSPQEIITSAFKNLGLMVTINQRLDFDQIELICDEFGFRAIREEAYEAELHQLPEEAAAEADLVPRAPVVTVMGHVDHGKTSLLDYIRKANVIAGEAGGITQHIGAYHVELEDGRSVTFLDTPGHEAFTAMRARGAEITDVVVLVVAADDAVMPQTVEALSHARNAGVPIVVAINKVDLPAADVPRVQRELLSHDVVLEEFGGDVLSTAVSAKTGNGVDELLEKVLLQAELLELRASPKGPARGTVVEAELDRGMGPVATVLVQGGTLRVGDHVLCGLYAGRVRALLDERGNAVDAAGPSTPARVLGLEGVPQAGDTLVVMEAARVREVALRRQQLEREKGIRRRARGVRLEDVFEQIRSGGQAQLALIIKGDTDGSVQALSDALERLSTGEVRVEVVHRGVGAVTESDVLLASTSHAAIIGFHVRPDGKARGLAEREGVEIRNYSVIYEAVEDVRLALEGLLEPEEREVSEGTAEVRALFRVPKTGTVAGCYVTSGTIRRGLPVRLLREHVQIYEGRIGSLRRFKDDVREVREGYECGISIEGYNDIKVGDTIECYRVEEVARSLAESSAAE